MDVWERQLGDGAYSGYGPAGEDEKVDWWWTPAGMATRYAIVAAIFAALVAFFLGGYWHAQRRIAQGKQPLAYHRWMVRRPYYAYPPPLGGGPSNAQGYAFTTSGAAGPGNENYPPPPPAYNNAAFPPPPSYQQPMPQQQQQQPPQGGSKALADQNFPAGFTHRAGESSAAQGNGETDASAATGAPAYGRETV